MSVKTLVEAQIVALSNICDLEAEVLSAFQSALEEVASAHLAKLASGASSEGGAKLKLTKKDTGKARVTKPKEDKISAKNAYHFFVAAKMGEVKTAGVEPKGRMKRIGEMWKALGEDERGPYKAMATKYNEIVLEAQKSDDWKARREDIVKDANRQAIEGSGIDVDDIDDSASIVSTVSTQVATPVVATPTPVATTTPAAKPKARTTKK